MNAVRCTNMTHTVTWLDFLKCLITAHKSKFLTHSFDASAAAAANVSLLLSVIFLSELIHEKTFLLLTCWEIREIENSESFSPLRVVACGEF